MLQKHNSIKWSMYKKTCLFMVLCFVSFLFHSEDIERLLSLSANEHHESATSASNHSGQIIGGAHLYNTSKPASFRSSLIRSE